MRNCIILGSGRSGTSMVAGALAKSGYFMGDDLYPGRESNPKGFFEAKEINDINEELLKPYTQEPLPFFGRYFSREKFRNGQRWLARIPLNTEISAQPKLNKRIEDITQNKPFCFKDPRFSYTLSAWRPFLTDTSYICVFRHPADTAKSIVKECNAMKYLQGLPMDFDIAMEVWVLMYGHILETHINNGSWLFIHFDQVLTREGLKKIESFLGTTTDHSFPDASLRRSVASSKISGESFKLYKQLCELADYEIRS